MKKEVKIAFLGMGVVGSKLLEYIKRSEETIEETVNVKLIITGVFVRDVTKKRSIDHSDLLFTDKPYEVIEEADIVIECLGGNGVELTKELVLAAIRMKKAVIMSSKKCLAWYGSEIMNEVGNHHTQFRYDASVGGGIPISTILKRMGKCETVRKIYGICNATSNFILTKMREQKISYEEALERAKENGYAENDSSEDVDGYDALYKSIILAGFGMNTWMNYKNIKPISIREIGEDYFLQAEHNDCVIKPIFCIEQIKDEVLCHVGVTSVPKDSLLACVNENNNLIIVEGSESGERAFYGQGAGAKPTASAMFDDLISILEHK